VREVGGEDLPLERRSTGSLLAIARERILGITLVAVNGWRASAHSKRSVHLKEVSDMLKMGVKVNSLGEDGSTRHAWGATSWRRTECRSDELTRLLAYHLRLLKQVLICLLLWYWLWVVDRLA
jgi:hypothetical protein